MPGELALGFVCQQVAIPEKTRITTGRLGVRVRLIIALIFVAAIVGGESDGTPRGSAESRPRVRQLTRKGRVIHVTGAGLSIAVGLPDGLLLQPQFREENGEWN